MVKKCFIFCLISLSLIFNRVIANESLLKTHLARPVQAEATMQALIPWETPVNGFFVRSHHGVPVIDEKKWVLQIDGLVEHPITLTLAELQKMQQTHHHAVLECSGNFRGIQDPPVPGVQWQRGAVGNAEWGGVRLADLLKKAGVKPEARFARIEGADKPILPSVPGFIRSIPLSKLLKPDTLLALKMNRMKMPPIQGGPVRLILPGWYGQNWIKWITHITLTKDEDAGFYMKKAYRMPKEVIKPGQPWDSTTGSAIEQLRVQSLIVDPTSNHPVRAGVKIKIRGKAFSGAGPIKKVELSTDQAKTWTLAILEKPHADGGWQAFQAQVLIPKDAKPFVILSRATDVTGATQPLTPEWNPGGYLRNSVDSVHLEVLKPGEKIRLVSNTELNRELENPPTVLSAKCLLCHSQEMIEMQRLTAKQWEGVVKKMEYFGVQLTNDERKAILEYLANSYRKVY